MDVWSNVTKFLFPSLPQINYHFNLKCYLTINSKSYVPNDYAGHIFINKSHTAIFMWLRSVCKSVILGIPIGITFLDTIGYVARVEGISMQPVLNPDSKNTDYVFLSRWSVRDYDVRRGDVISLVSPKDPNQKIIKRIVGLQGDVVSTLGYKSQYVRVPEGHCWVEGDHTGHTLDSNTFGPVSLGLVNARAAYIVWPPNRWQRLEAKLPESRKPLLQKQ